jgi:hypothetical protein
MPVSRMTPDQWAVLACVPLGMTGPHVRPSGCEEFLYTLKRRLRAARKRAVLAAEYRGTRGARIPQLAAARPRPALPGV